MNAAAKTGMIEAIRGTENRSERFMVGLFVVIGFDGKRDCSVGEYFFKSITIVLQTEVGGADPGKGSVAEAKQQQRRHSRSSQLLRPDRETALNGFRKRARENSFAPLRFLNG